MTMIDPTTGWFNFSKIPKFDLDEVTAGNGEYIYKSYARVSQLFDNTWIYRYPRPRKVVFDNISKFKLDFTPLINDFDIKPVLMIVKNPEDNTSMERLHQVILNILVTRDIDNKVFDHIDPWSETLAYIAWAIRSSFHRTIMATPGQAVFGRDMASNLASALD